MCQALIYVPYTYYINKSFQQIPVAEILSTKSYKTPVISPILQMKRLRHRESTCPGSHCW